MSDQIILAHILALPIAMFVVPAVIATFGQVLAFIIHRQRMSYKILFTDKRCMWERMSCAMLGVILSIMISSKLLMHLQ